MLEVRTSKSETQNDALTPLARKKGEGNVAWCQRALKKQPEWAVPLLLLGGSDAASFRLRAAQSEARHDLTPSYWSHVALMLDDSRLAEIPLSGQLGFPPPTNAVQKSRLQRYDDVTDWPNVAVLFVPAEREKVDAALAQFQRQRTTLDAVELLVHWLSYLWSVGHSPNPLLLGHGMPSAAMIEVVIGAAQFDLTPGLANRSSTPEAIWQSARWWHEYHASVSFAVRGFFTTPHSFLPTP